VIVGYESINHNGGLPGMHTQLYLYPGLNLGVYFTFGTIVNFPMDLAVAYITDVILNEEPWVNSQQLCFFSPNDANFYDLYKPMSNRKKPEVLSKAKHQLEEYAGTYGNFGYGNITVLSLPPETLILSIGRLGIYQLIPLGGDVFGTEGLNDVSRIWGTTFPNEVVFSSSSNGGIDTLTLFNAERTVFIRDLERSDAPPPPNVEC